MFPNPALTGQMPNAGGQNMATPLSDMPFPGAADSSQSWSPSWSPSFSPVNNFSPKFSGFGPGLGSPIIHVNPNRLPNGMPHFGAMNPDAAAAFRPHMHPAFGGGPMGMNRTWPRQTGAGGMGWVPMGLMNGGLMPLGPMRGKYPGT